jgi:hypothetical protein
MLGGMSKTALRSWWGSSRARKANVDRAWFLGALFLGLLLALPRRAPAKGQWCNDTNVVYRAEMTVSSAIVDGQPVTVPSGLSFNVTTSDVITDGVRARVFSPRTTDKVRSLDLQRVP